MFLGFQLFFIFRFNYETEMVYGSVVHKKVDAFGVIFKDEQIIDCCDDGRISVNMFRDGDHVAGNSIIVYKYSSEDDIKNLEKIKKIDEKIENLKQMQGFSSSKNQSFGGLNKQIYRNYFGFIDCLQNGDCQSVFAIKNKMIDCFNQRQILMGKISNFNESIANLKNERNETSRLVSSNPKAVVTPVTGYFVGSIDGFESKCGLEAAESFDVDRLKRLYYHIDSTGFENSKLGSKIIVDPVIYFKAFLPRILYFECEIGKRYCLKLDQIGEDFEAELKDFRMDPDGNFGLATFELDGMTRKLASLRKTKAEFNYKDYYGLKVSKVAIRTNDEGKPGVFVLIGSSIKFKLIDILAEDVDFVVSKIHDDDDSYLREFDEVVVKGKNLYNRRRIKK